jgi:hypothetical protein
VLRENRPNVEGETNTGKKRGKQWFVGAADGDRCWKSWVVWALAETWKEGTRNGDCKPTARGGAPSLFTILGKFLGDSSFHRVL